MTYVPLYRKWRSQNFKEIVGQAHIVTTLENAIKSDRISHAYLFSGPRGTGKTSMARIFAKALNCKTGPTFQPCGICDQCIKIRDGHAVDVIEIDAASNRGIDEIRDLREKVRYTPVEGKYKIYIIDEVHMLTSEAFNALLKTLEEPPKHAVFILATTEPQKVPVTISSRCQRLDFKRLTNVDVSAQLKKISTGEGIKIPDDAVALIARNSEGAMRDAISLLDQLVSFAGTDIKRDDIIRLLGTANADSIFDFGRHLAMSDTGKLLSLINEMIAEGRSIPQVTREILFHLRNIMLVKIGSGSAVEETTEHIEKLKTEAGQFTMDRLKDLIRLLSRAEVDMRWHPQARILLEIAVVEASRQDNGSAQPKIIIKAVSQKDVVQKEEQKPVAYVAEQKPSARIEAMAAPKVPNDPSLNAILSKWKTVLTEVNKKSLFAYLSLHEGEPSVFSSGRLSIKYKKSSAFQKERLEEASNKSMVEAIISSIVGFQVSIDCIIDEQVSKSSVSVDQVADFFGGKIVSK